ncbi:thioesterase family protein [Candidatus Bathyarchaeota archaeon]|nr:thioesterase family protein [Candidatus Bathyarchaeota archaeon]
MLLSVCTPQAYNLGTLRHRHSAHPSTAGSGAELVAQLKRRKHHQKSGFRDSLPHLISHRLLTLSTTMAATLADQVAVDPSGQDTFVSRENPGRMGNMANIAYGGCAIAIAIQAAFQTVSPGYLPYSVMGNYLGPAFIDRPLLCSVRRLRDTRTFATRQVYVSQKLDNGKERMCMAVLADFQVREKEAMYEYSAPPLRKYSSVEKSINPPEMVARKVAEGKIPHQAADLFGTMYDLKSRFMESRVCPEGVSGQNFNGVGEPETDQDHLPMTAKTSADWTRVRHACPEISDRFAALSFIMDESLSFLPLTHTNKTIFDAAACSSLDFAIRFFAPDLDLSQWHFREMNTVSGRDGRTYSESRMWDGEGNMVASMTQQSILRPRPGEIKANL